jgi:outer membrane immunogenic protein
MGATCRQFRHDNDNGDIVGGTFGGNFQTGALVFGVEGDWDYSGINTGTSNTVCIAGGNCRTGNTWLSTLRGRAGYAVDRVLFYLTAGGVFGNTQTTINGTTTTRTQAGRTAGLGVEYAFAQNGRPSSNTSIPILATAPSIAQRLHASP